MTTFINKVFPNRINSYVYEFLNLIPSTHTDIVQKTFEKLYLPTRSSSSSIEQNHIRAILNNYNNAASKLRSIIIKL